MKGLVDITLQHMFERRLFDFADEPEEELDISELSKEVARLPDKPDERLI
jgi:hypothetical protein